MRYYIVCLTALIWCVGCSSPRRTNTTTAGSSGTRGSAPADKVTAKPADKVTAKPADKVTAKPADKVTVKPPDTGSGCLQKFKASYPARDSIRVEELKDHYKIIVSHYTKSGDSAGAEGYTLHKKTCKTKMVWHEHPQRKPRPKITKVQQTP